MFGWFRRRQRMKPEVATLVQWDGHSIIIEGHGGEISRFRWDSVQRIIAFKQDLLTVDRIWLAFEGEGEPSSSLGAIHEDVIGFRGLVDEIGRRYPDHDPAWRSKVAFPAFAANPTVVWQRSMGAGAPIAESAES